MTFIVLLSGGSPKGAAGVFRKKSLYGRREEMMLRPLKKFSAFVAISVSTCVVLSTALFGGREGLPFHPVKEIVATPSALGMRYDDIRVRTDDGETLSGWFVPAAEDGNGPGAGLTVLFFHGNAGNISHRLESIAIFNGLGLDVLIIDYRGFGQSTGKPSVDGTVRDAEAAWRWLTVEKGVASDRIVIFGRSLGGGVAAALAATAQSRALILESTFTSLRDVAKDMFPWAPVRLFLPQDFDSPAALAKVRVPLLVVHSPDDEVVSFRFGQSLFDGYNGPKRFMQLHGSHNAGFLESRNRYVREMADFLVSLR